MGNGYEDLGFARIDTDRRQRCGRPEVVFCLGKEPAQAAEIAKRLIQHDGFLLATRATAAHYAAIAEVAPEAVFHPLGKCVTFGPFPPSCGLRTGIIAAGTADLPVSEEAAVTLTAFGREVVRICDVGVAGLHRLLAEVELLRSCAVLIVVAGMEGALPSVVAGLVEMPVIAVPTSVGYGTSFGGLTALLGMLNSCASKVTVVNIDNGFGAACAADAMIRMAEQTAAGTIHGKESR